MINENAATNKEKKKYIIIKKDGGNEKAEICSLFLFINSFSKSFPRSISGCLHTFCKTYC